LGNTQNEAPNININTEAQRYRVFIFLCVFVSLCCIYICKCEEFIQTESNENRKGEERIRRNDGKRNEMIIFAV